ncbi:hypothetical protein [Burkholderia sp. ISTR5]|uniref:hypothetical protein n=1 Tax=Burkholderia sp. ISTR5 TaxID=2500161 RepID=UPI00136B24FF|nr:hypothetical protein [Burkholderia sp. ISTR5]NBI44935.1 hypothetical protein [Burkholderia sp. ISTR5]
MRTVEFEIEHEVPQATFEKISKFLDELYVYGLNGLEYKAVRGDFTCLADGNDDLDKSQMSRIYESIIGIIQGDEE